MTGTREVKVSYFDDITDVFKAAMHSKIDKELLKKLRRVYEESKK